MKTEKFIQTKILFIILFCIGFLNLQAQDSKSAGIWASYSYRQFISKYRFWWNNAAEIDYTFNEINSTMYNYTSAAKFSLLNNLEFAPSVDLIYTITNDDDIENVFEFRISESVYLYWPNIGRFMFDHRYKFEQRFLFYSDRLKEEKIGLRSRYTLSVTFPLNNKRIFDNTFYISLSSQYFISHDTETDKAYAEIIRGGFMFGYRQNSQWRYSVTYYLDNGKNNLQSDRTVNNSIVSFSIINTIDINKSSGN